MSDYADLDHGFLGQIAVSEFTRDAGIHPDIDTASFKSWHNEDDLNLIVVFGSYDIITGGTTSVIEQRFPLSVADTTIDFEGGDPTPTPTPYPVSDLSSWMTFDSATLNVVNNEVNNVVFEGMQTIDTNKPSVLSESFDFSVANWTIVRRGDQPTEDDHDHGPAIESYATSQELNKLNEGVHSDLLGNLSSFSDYAQLSTNNQREDWSAIDFVKDTFMSFDIWKGAAELDIIVSFVTQSVGSITTRIEERFQLNLNISLETPTPVDFQPEEPTPTPTPIVVKDVSSWFDFDSATLKTTDGELGHVELSNVNVNDLAKPSFLSKDLDFEIIAWSIVKRTYDQDMILAHFNHSAEVWGTSASLYMSASSEGILSMSDYADLEHGSHGDATISDFVRDASIHPVIVPDSFKSWHYADELDLIVVFGSYDIITGGTTSVIEERFPLDIEDTVTDATPTPTPPDFAPGDPTPTPNNLSSWFSADSSTMNVVNNELDSISLSNVSIDAANFPDFLKKKNQTDLVSWYLVKRVFDYPVANLLGASNPQSYGKSHELYKIENGSIDISSEPLREFEDFASQDGLIGEWGISGLYPQFEFFNPDDVFNFATWWNEDAVDLIVVFHNHDFVTGANMIYSSERFQLSINATFVQTPTPTPDYFAPDPHTPTPTLTPIYVRDMTSWVSTDHAVIKLSNEGEVDKIVLSNVIVDSSEKPDFLSRNLGPSFVYWSVVKRSFVGSVGTALTNANYEAAAVGEDVYDPINLNSFKSFADFDGNNFDGNMGNLDIINFVKSTFMTFENWRSDSELDLIVNFVTDNGDVWLEDRFQLYLNEAPTPSPTAHEIERTLELTNTGDSTREGNSVSTSGDGKVVATSASSGQYDSYVNVYAELSDGTWTSLGNKIEGLGQSVSLNRDGTVLAVGESSFDNTRGQVSVYEYSGTGNWIKRGGDMFGVSPGEEFGFSVSLDATGDIVLVGAPGNSGYFSSYKWNGESWTQLGTPVSGTSLGDRFGMSVSSNEEGVVVAVGSPQSENSAYGYVGIYQYDGVDWQLLETIQSESDTDQLGNILFLNKVGDTLIVASENSNTIKTYVFNAQEQMWKPHGTHVSISTNIKSVCTNREGTFMLVGCTTDSVDRGRVFAYERTESGWESFNHSTFSGTDLGEHFGYSLSCSDTAYTIVVGSPNFNNSRGRTSVFKIDKFKPTPTPSPTPSPTPEQTPTPTQTPVHLDLPSSSVEDDVFLVRTEKPNVDSIYQYLHSYTPLYVLKKPLVGEDYVIDIDGDKVELELSDAKKLVFDPNEGGDDLVFSENILKWNLSAKELGQLDVTDPSKFDTNDPRLKIQRINTGCPIGCYYPNRGYLFQINLEGMSNLGFLGVYDTYYLAGIYAMETLQSLFYVEIVRSHTMAGFGAFPEYPLVNSADDYIPFHSYPPNLRFLNLTGNDGIMKMVDIPSSVLAINAASVGVSSIDDIQSDAETGVFPYLKVLNLSSNEKLYSIDGIADKAPALVDFRVNKCGILGKAPQLPDTVEILEISHNLFDSLTNLPTHLQNFLADKNKLNELPDIPKSAKIVNLSDNPLESWNLNSTSNLVMNSSHVEDEYELEELIISDANKFPLGLSKFTNLTKLKANNIPVDSSLPLLPASLTSVEVDNTGVTDLDGLSSCNNLNEVIASNNSIASIAGLNSSKQTIANLKINYNELEDGDFSDFTNAKKLVVSDNKLTSFTSPNVDELNFVGNPFTDTAPDLSALDGDIKLNLDTSEPPKGKTQKYEMSSAQKINALKTLSTDTSLNVDLKSSGMPLPDEVWWADSRIVSLEGGGSEINSLATSKIPDSCKSVKLTSTDITELVSLPTAVESLELQKNDLLENVSFDTQTNITSLNLDKNDNLTNVGLGSQPLLSDLSVGGSIQQLTGDLPELTALDVSNSEISQIEVTNAVKLKSLVASSTKIKSVDLTSYSSLETLNLSGCSELGTDENVDPITLPPSSNLTEVDVTHSNLDADSVGGLFTDLDGASSSDEEILKNFRYTGTARRPNSVDQNFKNLESVGWSVTPKEPTLDTYDVVAVGEKPVISRQELFESKETNFLFDAAETLIEIGGRDVQITGQEGEPFKFGNVLWEESEIGVTKRVSLGTSMYAKVTWFGYGSIALQINEFKQVEPVCMPSLEDEDMVGTPLGSFGYTLDVHTAPDISVGQPTKYIKFVNSLGNEFLPSEDNPLGFGKSQRYKFDLSEISEDDSIEFKAWKTGLLSNVETTLPISNSADVKTNNRTGGIYDGHIIIGPIANDVEWITWEFASEEKIALEYGSGRQFQVSKKCHYAEPTPTPVPTPTPTSQTSPSGYFTYNVSNNSGDTKYDAASYRTSIDDAIAKFDGILTGPPYQDWKLHIDVKFASLAGGILTDSEWTDLQFTEPTFGTIFPIAAEITINYNYLDSLIASTTPAGKNELYDNVLHAMGICMGIGKLTFSYQSINGLPVTAYGNADGITRHYYHGENALREYKAYFPEYADNIVGIPLEDSGPSSVHGEYIEEGHSPTIGSTDDRMINGYLHPGLGNEIMTVVSSGSAGSKLSKITIGLLADLGFSVDYSKADGYTPPTPTPTP